MWWSNMFSISLRSVWVISVDSTWFARTLHFFRERVKKMAGSCPLMLRKLTNLFIIPNMLRGIVRFTTLVVCVIGGAFFPSSSLGPSSRSLSCFTFMVLKFMMLLYRLTMFRYTSDWNTPCSPFSITAMCPSLTASSHGMSSENVSGLGTNTWKHSGTGRVSVEDTPSGRSGLISLTQLQKWSGLAIVAERKIICTRLGSFMIHSS
mmetsp:Transcript_33998/g.74888  ORF Transcript_33998/g.74888 Transcript_33998/m.74888 type:complete len:206 (-) Transcript_33998:97-714(-)